MITPNDNFPLTDGWPYTKTDDTGMAEVNALAAMMTSKFAKNLKYGKSDERPQRSKCQRTQATKRRKAAKASRKRNRK